VIRSYAPGEEIEITLTRNGQSSTVSLALGSSSKIG
jgi:S1-C subfamily serine protease